MYYFCQNMFYSVLFAITPETFPVKVRNTAIGVCNCAANSAAIISPLVGGLILDYTSNNLIFLIDCGAALGICAVMALQLLETNNFDPKRFFGKLDYVGTKIKKVPDESKVFSH